MPRGKRLQSVEKRPGGMKLYFIIRPSSSDEHLGPGTETDHLLLVRSLGGQAVRRAGLLRRWRRYKDARDEYRPGIIFTCVLETREGHKNNKNKNTSFITIIIPEHLDFLYTAVRYNIYYYVVGRALVHSADASAGSATRLPGIASETGDGHLRRPTNARPPNTIFSRDHIYDVAFKNYVLRKPPG